MYLPLPCLMTPEGRDKHQPPQPPIATQSLVSLSGPAAEPSVTAEKTLADCDNQATVTTASLMTFFWSRPAALRFLSLFYCLYRSSINWWQQKHKNTNDTVSWIFRDVIVFVWRVMAEIDETVFCLFFPLQSGYICPFEIPRPMKNGEFPSSNCQRIVHDMSIYNSLHMYVDIDHM